MGDLGTLNPSAEPQANHMVRHKATKCTGITYLARHMEQVLKYLEVPGTFHCTFA